MKNYFLLVILLFIGSSGYSQNVGIGTTTPVATLDVKGNHHLGGLTKYISFDTLSGKILWTNSKLFVSSPQYIMQHSASAEGLYYGNSQLEYRESMGNPIFFTNWSTGQGYFSGKLGIGTITPAFKLDVKNGSINTDSVYRIGTITVLSVRGTGNLLVGKNAGRINTGSNNTFSGEGAGYSNTVGFGNTAYGFHTLYSNFNGAGNTALGFQTLYHNIDGEANTAIGDGALFNNTGGKYNTADGYTSLYDNVDGWYNTAYGESALTRNISGSWNTANGGHALSYNDSGLKNTADGYWALSQNISGSLNTGVGYNSNVFTEGLNNATAIGANARVDCSNCLVLGSVNGIQGSDASVNVGIGVNNPNARLSISTNGNVLAGSATSNTLTTNTGTLSSMTDSEMSLANIGFMSGNNSSLGVRAYRTSPGSDWTSTSLLLEYDVDNTARVNSSYLALSANGNIGISKKRPAFKLDVANGSINTDSMYRIGNSIVLDVTSTGNLFVGKNTGRTGSFNTFSGDHAGYSNTEGYSNSFSGYQAGYSNTLGSSNSFTGYQAGYSNTEGADNSFYGLLSGYSNTTGFANAFFGNGAGYYNTIGGANSFFGYYAGQFNTMGFDNSFFGHFAGVFTTTGSRNSIFGESAGYSNSTGSNNSFFGESAGLSNSTGNENSFFGKAAGYTNTTGVNNSFFGRQSGQYNSTGSANSFFGVAAGYSNTTGDHNSFFGEYTGYGNTFGSSNSFFGPEAGYLNTTGSTNSFFGLHAAYNNSSGSDNTAHGSFALLANSTGTRNTALGFHADVNTGALTNATAIGANARADCSNCLVLGSTVNVNGANSNVNVGIGNNTPAFPLSFAPILGDKISLWSNSPSSYGFGVQGSKLQIHTDVIAADIVFGYGSSAAFTETMRIRGNGKVGIGTMTPDQALTVVGDICATGWIATCSDIRYKTDLTPISNSLEKVLQLHGLYYFLKTNEFPEKSFSDKRQIGFSAQELEEQFPEIVQTDTKGYKSVDYSRMTPILLEAIKEQQIQIDHQKNELEIIHDQSLAQQSQIDKQQLQIDALQKIVASIVAKK